MLKAGLKRRDSRAAVLEETLMSPDSKPNYFLPPSPLAGSRPERLNQLFAYLLLLCKYFGFFWPCLQSNFHLFFFFLNPIVLEVSLKSIQTNKRGKWHNPCRRFGSQRWSGSRSCSELICHVRSRSGNGYGGAKPTEQEWGPGANGWIIAIKTTIHLTATLWDP